jgi:DNA-binding NarL/FixJ family response regulator
MPDQAHTGTTMNEIPISPDIWKLAGEILTERQLTVLTLRERHGYSWHQICITLNSSKSTVREHHAAATRNIYNHLHQT